LLRVAAAAIAVTTASPRQRSRVPAAHSAAIITKKTAPTNW
jgi:hypothetical protein